MRVRKKKNGAERIEACSELLIKNVEDIKNAENIFGNPKPLHLEIGCGKGDFAIGMSRKNPDVNFIAMEKVADVCCVALEKAISTIDERPEDNLRFIIGDAKTLDALPENSFDRIYLNFSDPWPKAGHAKRRLTYRDFLLIYSKLLKEDGMLCFKTDNAGLYDFSLEEFEAFGATIIWQTRDLHNSEKAEDNVMTEYERNFSAKGFSICSAWVKLPKKQDIFSLEKLVKKSRSNRSFVPNEKIPYEELIKLCNMARSCPAAMNMQPIKYRLVHEHDELFALLSLTRWAASLDKKLPPVDHEPSAFIVMCHDTNIAPQKPIFMIDVGILAQTIMLGATEDGYGGCIIGSANEDEVAKLLGLSENLKPVLLLGLGVPEEHIVLTEAKNGQTKYFRDKNDNHYVPKRTIEEIIIK